jgi:hypothetical protein
MIKWLISILIFTVANLNLLCQVKVKGYYRANGTYVQPHYRTSPNSTPYDNYSFPGNYNPHTGNTASGDPDTYLKNLRDDNNSAPTSHQKSTTTPNNEALGSKAVLSTPNRAVDYSKSNYEVGSKERALARNGITTETFEQTSSASKVNYYTTAENLNVRSGPSTQFEVIGKLPRGALVSMVELHDQTWVKVRYRDLVGYVHKSYLSKN